VVQLDLDQPAGQQLAGRERVQARDPQLHSPGGVGQLPGDRAQGHRGVGHVGRQVFRTSAAAALDVGRPGLAARVPGPVLPRAGPDQQVAHGVGAAGQVREHVPPAPARQHGRLSQVWIGEHARCAQQALGRVVDPLTQLSLRHVHPLTLRS
jgi:hypothetical protein